MISPRYRRSGQILLAGLALGAVLAPGAALADGPGYGGTADTLTVQWQAEKASTDGLAVYAVGFRGGSPVQLRVGADAEQTIAADQSGALRVLVVNTTAATTTRAEAEDVTVLKVDQTDTTRFAAGTSVFALGETPAGDVRRLIGSVPPPAAGRGIQDLAPWAGALALLTATAVWSRRRGLTLATATSWARRQALSSPTAAPGSSRQGLSLSTALSPSRHLGPPPDSATGLGERPPSRHRHRPRHRAAPTHATA